MSGRRFALLSLNGPAWRGLCHARRGAGPVPPVRHADHRAPDDSRIRRRSASKSRRGSISTRSSLIDSAHGRALPACCPTEPRIDQRLDRRARRPGDGRQRDRPRRARAAGANRLSRLDPALRPDRRHRSALDALTSDLPAQPRLDSQGSLHFRFGGELRRSGQCRRRLSRRYPDHRRLSLGLAETGPNRTEA